MTIENKELTNGMVAERLGWKPAIKFAKPAWKLPVGGVTLPDLPDFLNDLNASKKFLYQPLMELMIRAGKDQYHIGQFLWQVMNRENPALAIAKAFMDLEKS